MRQLELLDPQGTAWALPRGFDPAAPPHFEVDRIILAKGSLATDDRERFVHEVCAVFPGVPIEHQLDVAPNRVELDEMEPARRIAKGKRTLVLGAIDPKSAVTSYSPRCRVYGHEWCFSVYGYCPFNCAYCYLPAVPGVWFSPCVRLYVNLPEILAEIDRLAKASRHATTFFLGTLQDGLALDPLSAFSSILIPFFAEHARARLIIQTKASCVGRLIDLPHQGHTLLSWTLTPRGLAARFEANAPSLNERIAAMARCAGKAYPVSVNLVPVIPYGAWEEAYVALVREVLDRCDVRQFVVGGLSMRWRAFELMRHRIGPRNPVLAHLDRFRAADGEERVRGAADVRDGLVRRLFAVCRRRASCEVVYDQRLGGTYAIRFGA